MKGGVVIVVCLMCVLLSEFCASFFIQSLIDNLNILDERFDFSKG